MTILGIDIGGSKTALVLGNPKGEVVNRRQFTTHPERGFEPFMETLMANAEKLLSGVARPLVCSVAVGGPLNEEEGVLLCPPHLKGWIDIPLGAVLRDALGLPVHILHDARAGAFAEWTFGLPPESNARRLAFVTFSTGFGMGLILDGRLIDIPGEIGHWRVAEDGPLMFGKRGSLESVASGAGIAAQAAATGKFQPNVSLAELATMARAGSRDARNILEKAAIQVGRQCARLIDLFGLDAISLGTIAIHAGDLLLERVRMVAIEEALAHLGARCEIGAARLGVRLGDVACLSAAIRGGHRENVASLGISSRAQLMSHLRAVERLFSDRPTLDAIDLAARTITDVLAAGSKVLTCGNGGSACDAAHLAEELSGRFKADRPALAALNLVADGPALTCIANDYGFARIFSRQVEALGRRGDALVAFTTSGNSENVNLALKAARDAGMRTIVFSGKGGGEAGRLADVAVVIPNAETARIQELHTFALHAVCEACEVRFRK